MIGWPQIIVVLVAHLRIVELLIAQRNTKRLLKEGGVEHGRRHYPLVVALHAAWLLALFVTVPVDAPIGWGWLVLFLLLQAGRLWVLLSLGRYWTTRVITLPEAPLVTKGPYRFMRHPNYLIVALEIAVLPLVFGAWQLALLFTLLNALVLVLRISVEERALRDRRSPADAEAGSSAQVSDRR